MTGHFDVQRHNVCSIYTELKSNLHEINYNFEMSVWCRI